MSGDDATAQARRIAERLLALRDRPPAPAPPTGLDHPRLRLRLRWLDGVLRLHRAVARVIAEQVVIEPGDEPEAPPPGDPLVEVLRQAHRVLLEHPVAAKAAFGALVAQGRAYAATAEGAALRHRLARSRRLRRANLLWRSLTMGMLAPEDPGELPATYLDNLLHAIDRADLEKLLGELQARAGSR